MRRTQARFAALLALTMAPAVVGCTSGLGTRTAGPGQTTTVPENRRGSGLPVRIAFAGDINFEEQMAGRLANDPATAIGPFSAVLSEADLAFANLESAVGTKGTPEPKDFTFQAPPKAIEALRAAGLDAVTMANNHGRDYGAVGLEQSLAIRDLQPDHFLIGIGRDEADALSAFTATVNGQRISVIAATQVLDDNLVASWTATPTQPGLASAKRVEQLVAAVTAARATSDTVVVFLHWGVERNDCPSTGQQTLAQQLVDAGADVVVGSHAHRLQGAGRLGTGFVAYGLGNFAFFAGNPDAAKTGVIEVTVTGRDVDAYRFIPGKISTRVPRPLDGAAAADALAYWSSLRPCTGLTE